MFGRPKPGETEEDILSMQQSYLQEKEKNKNLTPSAKVVKVGKHKSPDEPSSSKLSQYAKNKGLNKKSRVKFDEASLVDEKKEESDVEDDCVYYPSPGAAVLGEVVEKTYDSANMDQMPCTSGLRSALPPASARPVEDSDDAMNDSYDSTDFKALSDEDLLNMSMESREEEQPENPKLKCLEKSAILKGDDADEIHKKNMDLMKGMSEDEILKERQGLLDTMEPNMLAYIKNLRNTGSQENRPPPRSINTAASGSEHLSKKKEGDGEEIKYRDIVHNNIVQHPDIKKWLHFDTLEMDKLEWTKDMAMCQNNSNGKEPYEARFDFKGYLQPYTLEYTENTKTLFHHGEDPHRPGYTLNELFQLCRSSLSQQKVLALNTIAGILEYNNIGLYDNVIEIPITKTYFVLRFALDGNSPSLLEPALKAMRNLFYNKIDEACLDFLLCTERGLTQPRLVSSKADLKEAEADLSELKDFHLVDLDLVNGAIRTDLLLRLRYILTAAKPSFTCVECIIQILTRFCRDSLENVEKVFKTEGLMDFLFEHYVPKYMSNAAATGHNYEYCKLILDSLKMIRVAVSQSKDIAEICCSKYNIFNSLLSYIGNVSVQNTVLLNIQVEVFYLWSCFINYGLGMYSLVEIKGLLLRVLDNHAKTTELTISYNVLMHSHAAALITLLTSATLAQQKYKDSLPDDYFEEFLPIMMFAFEKWSNQLSNMMAYTAGHLKSVSALLTYMSTSHKLKFEKFNSMPEIDTYLQQMFHCDGFLVLASNLVRNSNLLATVDVESSTKKMMKTNIPGLNASLMSKSQNVLPIVTVPSPICFLLSLSKYISITKNKRLCSDFVLHNIIVEYLKEITSAGRLNLTDNWFTKLEIDFLCNVLHLAIDLGVSDVIKEILYNLAFKLTYILTVDSKPTLFFILERFVFNKNWFSTERLMRNLNITEATNILNHCKDIFECYVKVLDLDSFHKSSALTVSNWNEQVLPRDWIFMPVLALYTKSLQLESSTKPKNLQENEKVDYIVYRSVQWILISELYYSDISSEISITDRFCRLCCVYLCDNAIFLDPKVKPLLNKCIKIIFNLENSPICPTKFNFDRGLIGINSFEDFFTKLVDQFQAVSYGDPMFAACILAPLAQRHNVKWRKIVWSEYAACLRALDCPKEYLCYKIEQYLDPPELDFSLLECYHHALVSNLIRPKTIVYQIAQNHIEYAKSRQRRLKTD